MDDTVGVAADPSGHILPLRERGRDSFCAFAASSSCRTGGHFHAVIAAAGATRPLLCALPAEVAIYDWIFNRQYDSSTPRIVALGKYLKNSEIRRIQSTFASRLDTLAHLLNRAEAAYGADAAYLAHRLAPDMHPFGTQIAFTCNQPRNFALWCAGKPTDNLDPNVASVECARDYIANTKALLLSVECGDSRLDEITRIDLGPNVYAELPGAAYVNEFLVPNFYFHLVTAYDILRMAGLDLGKRDYMQHMLPFVKQG